MKTILIIALSLFGVATFADPPRPHFDTTTLAAGSAYLRVVPDILPSTTYTVRNKGPQEITAKIGDGLTVTIPPGGEVSITQDGGIKTWEGRAVFLPAKSLESVPNMSGPLIQGAITPVPGYATGKIEMLTIDQSGNLSTDAMGVAAK